MKFSFKLALVTLLIGSLLGIGVASVLAQDTPAPPASPSAPSSPSAPADSGRAEACLSNFSAFITTLLGADDAKDYFQDLFERNRCQQDDIFALDSRIESKTDTLRGMYFDRCSSPEITELQGDIRELKMEQYFVRHIVPVAEDATYKRDAEALERDFDAIKFALFLDMKDRFADKKKWLTEEELDALMVEWLDFYDDRIPEYVSCSTSPWQEVADKWKEFQEGIKELANFGGARSESAKDREAEQQAEQEEREEEANTSAAGEKNGGGASVPGFLKKMFSLRLNGVDSKRGTQDLYEDFKAQGDFLTVEEALRATQFELERYDREKGRAELLATYDLLYSQGSADITNDLVTRLQTLRSTIEATTKGPLHGLAESAKGIHSKQGKTKP